MTAWYNEPDPFKAAVIREAIKAGAIAPGDVDERNIQDVRPADLVGYTQCHFFAGGGFWSLALRNAGWPDERPVWTGSCPCPGFSVAGKGGGFADPRHLWPFWLPLIRECGPRTIFGEQADGAIGHGWLDLVSGDLEAEDYAFAAAVLGAHSVGAPHRRHRLYFGADAAGSGYDGRRPGEESAGIKTSVRCISVGESQRLRDVSGSPDPDGRQPCNGDLQCSGQHGLFAQDCGAGERSDTRSVERQPGRIAEASDGQDSPVRSCNRQDAGTSSSIGSSADALHPERWPVHVNGSDGCDREDNRWTQTLGELGTRSEILIGTNPLSPRLEGHFGHVRDWRGPGWLDPFTARSVAEAGATRGFWADCDWWYGRDGKWRPTGPGVQSLAHGSAARVGRLRLYGDAICVETAATFIAAWIEAREETERGS